MKLERLSPTTQSISRDTVRRPHAEVANRWHIDALDGTEADRGYSLQQELALAEDRGAASDVAGAQAAAQDKARDVAEKLCALGARADDLLRTDLPRPASLSIDDQA